METFDCKFNERKFGDLWNDIMRHSPDYADLQFEHDADFVAYWGVEYRGNPKHPNETLLGNLKTKDGEIVLGSTFGHMHTQHLDPNDSRTYQELYEFFGYGAMLLRNEELGTRLYLLRPRQKVLVRNDENMMIMNLDQKPLFTHDYADPAHNSAHKHNEQGTENEKGKGPFLMVRCKIDEKDELGRGTVSFYVNPHYNPIAKSPLVIPNVLLGADLYNKINDDHAEDFEKDLGIKVIAKENLPKGLKEKLASPLIQLALSNDPLLLQTFKNF